MTATVGGAANRTLIAIFMLPVPGRKSADVGTLMGGAIVTEGIFNINGIGREVYWAVVTKEGATVVSIVVILVLVKHLYVREALDEDVTLPGEPTPPTGTGRPAA